MKKILLPLSILGSLFLGACSDNTAEITPTPTPGLSSEIISLSSALIDPSLSSIVIDPGLSSAIIDPGLSSVIIDPNLSSDISISSSGEVPLSSAVEIPVDILEKRAAITKECSVLPAKLTSGSAGYGTRYWDCCKAHCSWPDNTTPDALTRVCNQNNQEIPLFDGTFNSPGEQTTSSCDGGDGFTCYSQAPFAICKDLAYGFAAVPANSDICGKCYQLDFDGGAKYGNPKNSHKAIAGKTMIVMATNIGHDVAGGQFDIMIPGGGVGAFDQGCKRQWNATSVAALGQTYGGFLKYCQEEKGLGWDNIPKLKTCVSEMCTNLFAGDPGTADLLQGCDFFVNWMEVADNPTFTYQEVECPQVLKEMNASTFH